MNLSTKLSRFKKQLCSLKQSTVFLNILGLATATAVSQIVVLCAAPFITRLYDPKAFGVFSTYLAVVAIVSSFSGLRFDAAIPVPRSEKIAQALSVLAIASTLVVSFTAASAAVCLHFGFPELNTEIKSSIFLTGAFAVLAWGLFRVLQQWVIRKRVYELLRGVVMLQTGLQVSFQIILGVIQPTAMCLVSSDLAKAISAILFLRFRTASITPHLLQFNTRDLYVAALRYRKFALYSSFAALLNAVSTWFLPIFMAATFDFTAAGLVGLCQRIVGAPTSLIANSVSKIYTGELAISRKESPADARKLFQKTAGVLIIGGFLLIVIIGIPGLFLAGSIFGEDWQGLGTYVFILSFVYAAKMVAFPLGSTLDIYKAQGQHLIREMVRVVFIVVGIVISLSASLSALETVCVVAICQTMGHLSAVFIAYRVVQQKINEI